jgi:RimJ/RimL family protein N-acetyltransferase
MSIQTPLFEGQQIRFTAFDYDKDSQIESQWTHNPTYLRMLGADIARPLAAEQVKKKYEEIEKEEDEKRNLFYFAIRTRSEEDREEERLIGFARLYWIEWSNATGNVQVGIGNPDDRERGYGSEAVHMLLRFAFDELNLFRLTALIPEYNQAARHLFERAGFSQEVRRRQALQRDGRRWDMLHMGILRQEWERQQNSSLTSEEATKSA